jgi:hypothetical protein
MFVERKSNLLKSNKLSLSILADSYYDQEDSRLLDDQEYYH